MATRDCLLEQIEYQIAKLKQLDDEYLKKREEGERYLMQLVEEGLKL